MSPTNDSVRAVNAIVLKKLPGDARQYLSETRLLLQDRGSDAVHAGGFHIAQEELDSISPARIPPHRLELKVGAFVMLLMNLNKRQGLCNGTRFIVTKLLKESICVRRLTPFRGQLEELFLPRMVMRTDDVPVAGSIERLQIPVALAFCITINKSQGQTFDYVGLFLRRPVFSHGQYFVAVSRGKNREHVHIAVVNGILQGKVCRFSGGNSRSSCVKTKNIEIKELL